jgi:hypothetical protein
VASSDLPSGAPSLSGAPQRPGPEAGVQFAPLTYHAPLLRSHGALHELTTQKMIKSGDGGAGSDVNSKENIVPIIWD